MASIIIVEDDVTFSLMLSTWLKRKDFEIHSATSVREAKQAVKANRYDLVLSDLRLPDGDGIDLLKWLGEQSRSIPLIMRTS
jgi:two-component system response regulator HydG